MTLLAQALADGLMFGGVLALVAVGFSLVFGVMGVINLSHGALVLVGAYLAVIARRALGLDPLLAIPLVAVVMFPLGYAYERWVISVAVRRASLLSSLLVTFGMALVIRNILTLLFSSDTQSLRPDYASLHAEFGSVVFDLAHAAGLAASLLLIGALAAALHLSSLGRVIRATAQQELAARLCGVNVRGVHAATFGIAAAFAGTAGVVIGLLFPFSPSSEATWTTYAFIVVVLGGVGSPAGALLGGLLLGIISSLTGTYIGAAFPNAVAFGMLVLMLMVRPNGLLGNAFGGSR